MLLEGQNAARNNNLKAKGSKSNSLTNPNKLLLF